MSAPANIDLSTGRALRDVGADERWRRVQLLWQFVPRYRRDFLTSLGTTLAMVVLDIAAIWVLKEAIERGRMGVTGAAIDMTAVAVFCGAAVAVVFLRWAVQALNYVVAVWAVRVLADLRVRLFEHVQDQDLAFFQRYKTGVVISRMTNDVDALSQFVSDGVWMVIRNGSMLVGIEVVLFIMDWRLALAINVLLPLMVAATVWFRSRSSAAYRIVRERLALVTSHLAESIGGIRVIHTFAAEARMQERFDVVIRDHQDANMRTVWLNAVYFPIVELIAALSTGVVLWYAGILSAAEALQLGVLFAFVAYLNDFFDPIQQLSQFYNSYLAAMAALDKIADVLDEAPAITSPEGALPLDDVSGSIAFEHVSFRYAPDLPDVLTDIDLQIAPGEQVAIVGHTGAGKSTLVKLLGRFHDPGEGTIRLDGVDLRELPVRWLRQNLGMVPQEGFLFAGSVRDNIRFARPEATDDELEQAVAALGADEILERLTDGLDTEVGERGDMLSAGERQLVAFARAMLVDPPVLVLDEATSSVDVSTERQLVESLKHLLEGRTAVIVAHRLSTILGADRIIVLDDGRIVEQGTHDELIAAGGPYSALYREWQTSATAG